MLSHDDIDWKWHRWRQVSKDQFSPRKENTWKGSHSGQKNGKIVRNTIGWIIRLGTGMIHISVPYSHLTWIWNRKWTASLYPSFTSCPCLDGLFIFYPIIKKIRIGYVLKSADVGTLFSSRHSENSSQAHTRRHPHTFTHTCTHLWTPTHTAHPCAYPHTLLHTRAHP